MKAIRAFTVLFVAVVACGPALSEEFDWRAYPGNGSLPAGNYITPVRNQGSAGTCWAFAAAAATEAKYDITFHITNSTLDLSEQNLVCAGKQLGFGDILGGWEDSALDYIRDKGIVTEAAMPYTATNSSPYWPLTGTYQVYRIASDIHYTSLSANPATLKAFLKANGPVTAAIDSTTDWYTPGSPVHYSAGHGAASADGTSSSDGSAGISLAAIDELRGNPNNLDHALIITGFTDDANVAGGGYWHLKNSWGSTWGPTGDGYGYITYATILADNYVTGIDGLAYAMMVPEPVTLSLLAVGGVVLLGRRKRRFAA